MATNVKDYYLLLGLSADASENQVRRAYRKLARKYHPDLNPGNKLAEDKFKEISEAYGVLSDPTSRRQYDEAVEAARFSPQFVPERGAQINVRFSSPPRHQTRSALSGILNYVFGKDDGRHTGANRQISSQGATSGSRSPHRRLEAEVSITLEEAHRGAVHRLTLNQQTRCPSCKGARQNLSHPCGFCGGTGVFQKSNVIDVSIPAGARNGSVIKVPSRVFPGQKADDLYIKLAIKPHEVFSIDGDDLQMDLPITPWEAVLGTDVEIATIDGKKTEIRIPAAAQGGKRIRLRGHGLNTRDGGRGDLYVRLNIVVQPEPDERERDLYREMAKLSKFHPR